MVCCYSLIMFSAFVPDPFTRYQCGWQLICLMALTLGVNLSVIGVQAISGIYAKCKLCYKKRQAKKFMQNRLKEMELKKAI